MRVMSLFPPWACSFRIYSGLMKLDVINKPKSENQWSCKRSANIWAYHRHKHKKPGKMAEQTLTLILITHKPSFNNIVYYINQILGHMMQ